MNKMKRVLPIAGVILDVLCVIATLSVIIGIVFFHSIDVSVTTVYLICFALLQVGWCFSDAQKLRTHQ